MHLIQLFICFFTLSLQAQNFTFEGKLINVGKTTVKLQDAVLVLENGIEIPCNKKGNFELKLPAEMNLNTLIKVKNVKVNKDVFHVLNSYDVNPLLVSTKTLNRSFDIYISTENEYQQSKQNMLEFIEQYDYSIRRKLMSIIQSDPSLMAQNKRLIGAYKSFSSFHSTLIYSFTNIVKEQLSKNGKEAFDLFFEKKDLNAAQKLLENSINYYDLRFLANIYTLDFELSKASEQYFALYKKDPNNIGLIEEYKKMAIWCDDYEGFATILKPTFTFVKDNPFLISAYNDIASYYYEKKEIANAVEYMEKALSLQFEEEKKTANKKDIFTIALMFNLMQAYDKAGESEKALSTVDTILTKYNRFITSNDKEKSMKLIYAVTNHYGGSILSKKEQYSKAFPYFERMFKFLDENPYIDGFPNDFLFLDRLHYCMGLEQNGGNLKDCAECYESVLVFAGMQNDKEGKEALASAMVYYKLAKRLSDEGEGEKAADFYQKVINVLETNDTEISKSFQLEAIACGGTMLGDYGLSNNARALFHKIEKFKEISKLDGKSIHKLAQTWYSIGLFHRKMNEKDSAMEAFLNCNRLLINKLNPDSKDSILLADSFNTLGDFFINYKEDKKGGLAHFEKAYSIFSILVKNGVTEAIIKKVMCTHNILSVWSDDLANTDKEKALKLIREAKKDLLDLREEKSEKELYLDGMETFEAIFNGKTDVLKSALIEVQNLNEQRKKMNGNIGKTNLQKRIISALQKAVENSTNNNKSKFNELYVTELGNLAWYAIFDKQYSLAEQSARKALDLDPNQTWIYTNLAHSLILQGKKKEGIAIYEQYKNQFHRDGKLMKFIFLEDIEALQKANINHIDFKEVISILKK